MGLKFCSRQACFRVHPNKSAELTSAPSPGAAKTKKYGNLHLPKPEWLRIDDVVRLYNIGRSSLYELISEGKIKSASIKKRGNIRGIRLISVASIEAFLESLAEGGVSETSHTASK